MIYVYLAVYLSVGLFATLCFNISVEYKSNKDEVNIFLVSAGILMGWGILLPVSAVAGLLYSVRNIKKVAEFIFR